MAFEIIVETGAGVENANSYVAMSDADNYFEMMGKSDEWAPDSPDDARMSALIRGAAYVDRKYSDKWPGSKTHGRAQSLAWPRTGAYDSSKVLVEDDEIPREIKRAQMEAAIRELASPGSLSPDVVGGERIRREKVEGIEIEYAPDSLQDSVVPVITAIDEILAPLIGTRSSTATKFLARA